MTDSVECPHCEAASIYSEDQLQNHIEFFHSDEILTDGGQDLVRYIEIEAPGIGIVENSVAGVVCASDGCSNTVEVDPETNVVEGPGREVQSEEFDMEVGQSTGRMIVEIYCSDDCVTDAYGLTKVADVGGEARE